MCSAGSVRCGTARCAPTRRCRSVRRSTSSGTTSRPSARRSPPRSWPTWYAGVAQIANPVRRDYLRFALFSGLRREAAAAMRWEHVDFDRRVLHVPKPKGGEERAFYLPLSDYLLTLLQQRQRENPTLVAQQVIPDDATEWVWPAYSATGHIAEPRETIRGVRFTIHDLRRTFRHRRGVAKHPAACHRRSGQPSAAGRQHDRSLRRARGRPLAPADAADHR